MTIKDLPKDSFTYKSARLACNDEHMVPLEAAWQLEQQVIKNVSMLRKARRKLREPSDAYNVSFKDVVSVRALPDGACEVRVSP
jgi:hypothetical protein